MNVGILILHYNTPAMTDKLAHTVPEAIVIDNGSSDEGSYRGANRCWKIEPVNGASAGFTRGWNCAIEHFKGSYEALWLMNSDIQIERESIERVTMLLDRTDIKILSPSFNSCWRQMKKTGGGLREVKFVEFTAPAIKTEVFDRIGLFEERMTKGYAVDADFCFRAAQRGLKTFVDDGSSFIHLEHQTIKTTATFPTYSREASLEMARVMKDKYGATWRQRVMGISGTPIRGDAPRRPPGGRARALPRESAATPGTEVARWEIINHLAAQFASCRYLEIGSFKRECFNKIRAPFKSDIDPRGMPKTTYAMPSDDAFRIMQPEEQYDVIFIDGLHHCEQVIRDVFNAGRHLSPQGYIVLHDCRPPDKEVTLRKNDPACGEKYGAPWYGDVYKAHMWLVKKFDAIVTINDERTGCGIIHGKINFELPPDEELLSISWDDYREGITSALRLISWADFKVLHADAPSSFSRLTETTGTERSMPATKCIPPVFSYPHRGNAAVSTDRTAPKIAVYTAIFNRYDDLKPIVPQSLPADFICLTDNSGKSDRQWRTGVPDIPEHDLSPRLRNRWCKLFPGKIEELNGYDITIYLDGNCTVRSPDFIRFCIDGLAHRELLVFRHPSRSCVYEEFVACRHYHKFDGSGNDREQERDYRRFYPAGNGLYWCGCLVRRRSENLQAICEQWWEHLLKYTWRDQLSFPVVCYMNGFTPSTFDGSMDEQVLRRPHIPESIGKAPGDAGSGSSVRSNRFARQL
jgi:GT2 family glycosyltransferase